MNFEYGTYGYIAEKDAQSADRDISVCAWDDSVFFMQQALEKMLKEYISRKFSDNHPRYETFMSSHSLLFLCEAANIAEMKPYFNDLDVIENSYSNSRYPGIYVEFTATEAMRLHDTFKRVFPVITQYATSEPKAKAI